MTKPGIIYGNAITLTGGFLLASRGHVNGWLLLATLVGSSLVVAAGCVLNNYIDREIDQKMARTKERALVRGAISDASAIAYGVILGLVGLAILAVFTNILTVWVGLVGLFTYLIFYGIAKRRSVHGTIVGCLSGAAPPVAGYTAVTGKLDLTVLIICLIMVFWQLAHFYAIAMNRRDDYAAANIPVMPVQKGMQRTKTIIMINILAFIGTASLLTIIGATGTWYLVTLLLLGCIWLWLGFNGLQRQLADRLWAKRMFLFSLVVVTMFSAMISVDTYLR